MKKKIEIKPTPQVVRFKEQLRKLREMKVNKDGLTLVTRKEITDFITDLTETQIGVCIVSCAKTGELSVYSNECGGRKRIYSINDVESGTVNCASTHVHLLAAVNKWKLAKKDSNGKIIYD
jgi:hypothetical protein